jgi:hypothetical protein
MAKIRGYSTEKYYTRLWPNRLKPALSRKVFDAGRRLDLLDAGLADPGHLTDSEKSLIVHEQERRSTRNRIALRLLNKSIDEGHSYMLRGKAREKARKKHKGGIW